MYKILFELNHPKHYLQYKPVAQLLNGEKKVSFVAKDKDVLLQLLDNEGYEYLKINSSAKSIPSKLFGFINYFNQYKKIINELKPDLIISKASPYAAIAGKVYNVPTVITPDSEVVQLTNKFVSRLSTYIITPQNFKINYGSKHFRVNGFFEDQYLHPDVFEPSNGKIKKYGIDPEKPYFVLRFVGWSANHDIGKRGIANYEKFRLVETLQKYGRVYISSEQSLPDEFKEYILPTPPHLIHQVLHYARLYIGDSQTMATEAALLGTPAIRCNSFVGDNDMSNFIILEKDLKLLFNIPDIDGVIDKAFAIIKSNSKQRWLDKRIEYYNNRPNINLQMKEIIENILSSDGKDN